ncbi:Type I restriction-modification system methyltransferase subunit [Bartonella ancashensis]|uniref:Type I restriction-modification system methyltransferase subunit n=2 Tax=Bartonella ancashensis TaxID=1318743 RepID=A0A0M3T2K0_9HYPH|nr:Type I restriction-modification system methyltransferase subunit [Bartonella ancashensis]
MILMGTWVCIVTLGALAFSMNRSSNSGVSRIQDAIIVTNESHDTEIMSIPILVEGVVQGYIVTQLTYVIDRGLAREISIPVDVLIHDSIFQQFWGSYSNVRMIEKISFEDVKQQIIEHINQRSKQPILKDLLVKQFNYLSVDKVRQPIQYTG